MAAEAKANAGSKLSICVLLRNEDITATECAALTFVQVKKVGSIGERGINTNVVQYDTLDTLVALRARASPTPAIPRSRWLRI
ncbi:hypothetical protein [Stenotrophomonas indicatrix]|uniref:hypothetical protein n=1 Tax=Stenotrophomonas indicatrix TaxID=2045451 RepID=UPI001CBE2552|nr:hypothetical protein [Stenotrophomonas indicatrix]